MIYCDCDYCAHSCAFFRQEISPRSSNEAQKWIEWEEYLCVVSKLRDEYLQLKESGQDKPSQHKMIATAFQRYLVLAIFSRVPDRQRTIRELEIDKTLMKDNDGNWIIKHGPNDYKTGKTYGDRPPLDLQGKKSHFIFFVKSNIFCIHFVHIFSIFTYICIPI